MNQIRDIEWTKETLNKLRECFNKTKADKEKFDCLNTEFSYPYAAFILDFYEPILFKK